MWWFLLFVLAFSARADPQGNSSLTAPAYGEEVADTKVHSPVLEVVSGQAEAGVLPTLPTVNTMTSLPEPRKQPYLNTYQRQQTFYPSSRAQQPLPQSYSQAGLNILSYAGEPKIRPTLDSLNSYAASQGREVTTPQELLEMCCQFPACYDPLYQLCIDTCRKCETVYPVTSWLPCPPLLNIPDCTSPNLSWMGSLPLVCYPDIGPFGNIIPLNSISAASRNYGSGKAAGRAGESVEQSYRISIRSQNMKQCTESGICRSEGGNQWTNGF